MVEERKRLEPGVWDAGAAVALGAKGCRFFSATFKDCSISATVEDKLKQKNDICTHIKAATKVQTTLGRY